MGAVITVMNMKGGVGKTTVATHLAGMAARYRLGGAAPKKVLAIDYDPQFNLSQALLPHKKYFELEKLKRTTLSILVDDDIKLNPYQLQVPGSHKPPSISDVAYNVYNGSVGALDVVPSTLELMYIALGRADAQIKPIEERFKKFIAECRDVYDLIFIDCHPAGSIFTKTSLNNSDHVLIPVVPRGYAVRGIGLMMRFIEASRVGIKGPQPHILFNCTPRVGAAEKEPEIRANPAYSKYCMNQTLKWYKAFSEPEGGNGFVWNSTKPYSTEAFSNLQRVASELMKRIGVK